MSFSASGSGSSSGPPPPSPSPGPSPFPSAAPSPSPGPGLDPGEWDVSGVTDVADEFAPLDPAAPPIRFEVNLPEQWNGKAVQYGGAGFNGVLITGLAVPSSDINAVRVLEGDSIRYVASFR